MSLRSAIPTLSLLAAVLASAGPARGVVINVGDGSGQTSAPTNDPGWNNVGVAGGGTAEYLGNRWVITADHVGVQSVTFGSQTYLPEANTAVQLSNPTATGVTGDADLLMYRLTTSPGLPSLSIATSTPTAGTSVTMIGDGGDRAAAESYWNVTANSNGTYNWAPVAIGGNQQGYLTTDTRQLRYGTNSIATNGDILSTSKNGDTISMATVFSSTVSVNGPAQAVPGDSGGGVFVHTISGWHLSGIIDSMQTLGGQPTGTAVFGDETLMADLSQYRTQINSLLASPDPNLAWQNPTNPLDVNNDGIVSSLDALVIINELNNVGPHTLPLPPVAGDAPPPYYDVAGSDSVSSLDALMILNYLNSASTAQALTQVVAGYPVAEPSTAVLAALGMAGLLAWRWRNSRSENRRRPVAIFALFLGATGDCPE